MNQAKSVRMTEEFLEGGNVSLRQIDTQVHLENFKTRLDKWSLGKKPIKLLVAPFLLLMTFFVSLEND